MTDLWQAIGVSLYCSITATALCAAAGIPAGCALAMREFRGKRILLGLLNTLLSLPTVVVGLLGYLLLSRRSPLGPLGLLFTPGAVIRPGRHYRVVVPIKGNVVASFEKSD